MAQRDDAQRNDSNIVTLPRMEVMPLSRDTQLRLDRSDDELFLHEAIGRASNRTSSRMYRDTAHTVREDIVHDATEEARCIDALGLDGRQFLQGLRQLYEFHHANALQNRLDRIQEAEEIHTAPLEPMSPGALLSVAAGLLHRGGRRRSGRR